MFIEIKYKDEKKDVLGWLIDKNPKNTPIVKNLENGVVFGWFENLNIFRMYFADSFKPSFSNNDEHYLSFADISSAKCAIFMLEKMCRSAYTKPKKEMDIGIASIKIPVIKIRQIDRIEKFLYVWNHNIEHKKGEIYSLELYGKNLEVVLKRFIIILACIWQNNKEDLFVTDEYKQKYAKLIQETNSPYNIRSYLKIWLMYNDDIELLNTYNMQLKPYTLQRQREIFIQNLIPNNPFLNSWEFNFLKFCNNYINIHWLIKILKKKYAIKILDFGCGEGRYVNLFKNNFYYGVDINKDIINKNKKRYPDINFGIDVPVDIDFDYVIISEVIEHMNISDVPHTLWSLFDNFPNATFIITTPNIEFNKNFLIDNFRHDDHKFELTSSEFKSLINDTLMKKGKFFFIGDSVNNVQPTQGVIIKND